MECGIRLFRSSKVTVMVKQNRYSKLRIPSQLHTLRVGCIFGVFVFCFMSYLVSFCSCVFQSI